MIEFDQLGQIVTIFVDFKQNVGSVMFDCVKKEDGGDDLLKVIIPEKDLRNFEANHLRVVDGVLRLVGWVDLLTSAEGLDEAVHQNLAKFLEVTLVVNVDEAIESLVDNGVIQYRVAKPVSLLQDISVAFAEDLDEVHQDWEVALSRSVVDQRALIVVLQGDDVEFAAVLGAVPVFEEPHELEVSMVTRIVRDRGPRADVEHSVEGVDKPLVNQDSDRQERALAGEVSYVQGGLVPLVELLLRDGTRFIVIRIIRVESIGGTDEGRTGLPRVLALFVV